MSKETGVSGPAFAKDLPFSKWLRLAFLGNVKGSGSGERFVIARQYGRFLNVLNALAPIVVVALLISGALKPSYSRIAIIVVLWVILNVLILRRAPIERK